MNIDLQEDQLRVDGSAISEIGQKSQSRVRSGPTVLHVISGMGKGGAEKIAMQLAVAKGNDGSLAFLKGRNHWEAELNSAGVKTKYLAGKSLIDIPACIKTLVKLIRENRPDVLHTHLLHAHIVGRFAARFVKNLHVISTEHNLRVYSKPFARFLDKIDVRTSRQNRSVIAISEATRAKCLECGYRNDTLSVIYNGVSVPANTYLAATGDLPTITMVGRLHLEKGPDVFLRALELVPNVRGVLFSEQTSQSEWVLEKSANVKSRFTWLQSGDPMAALSNATIVVVPSRFEGLGLVALEAMSLGKPVIASRIGGLTEVVVDGVTGLLVSPDNPEELAAAIQGLLADPCRCVSFGNNGRERVLEKFTLSNMISNYEAIYNRCLTDN